MNEMIVLRDLSVIFAVAVAVVALLHRFGIPSIAGFILAGILAGKEGLGLISGVHDVEGMAEIGVILLLFSIGSEFSLERLRRMWRPILAGGMLQVGLTTLIIFLIAIAFDFSWQTSVFMGWLISLSSTAIVLRGLEKRGEVDAPHGRLTLGILLFQDLSVVPIMFAIPILAGENTSLASLGVAVLRSVLILCGVLILARFAAPRILHAIARTRQRELFVLSVLLICMGTAWLATMAGISLSLGAFLAGLVVADSDYRHQALADIIPFREGFSSLFFISIGMMLHPSAVWENSMSILLILVGILLGKTLVVLVTGLVMRLPLRVCILAGVALAQVGEFSFVLIRASMGTNLFGGVVAENIMAATILSMVITPFALALGPRLAAQAERGWFLARFLHVTQSENVQETKRLSDHVIIGGYGFAGEELTKSLRSQNIPYVIVELNPDNVRRAVERGERVYYGDITSEEVLRDLGVERAREMVIVINDPSAVEKAVAAARRIAPSLYILVRARYRLDVGLLSSSGANEVIPDEVEAAAQIASRVLSRYQIDNSLIEQQCARIRNSIP